MDIQKDQYDTLQESSQQMIEVNSLEDHVSKNKMFYFMNFFVIGLMNNLGFVAVVSSQENLADHFKMKSFMGSFQFCLSIFSSLARVINSKYMINYPHSFRLKVMFVGLAISFGCLSLANSTDEMWGFYVSLIGASIVGMCCSFGESVVLGYTKEFPSEVVSGWSSGTGMAGVFGAGFYIFTTSINFPDNFLFLFYIPFVILSYIYCFRSLENKRIKYKQRDLNSDQQQKEEQENVSLNLQNIVTVYPKVAYFAINLGLVYFLEYASSGGFSQYTVRKANDLNWAEQHSFVILQFCYQFGVLISRSSLQVIKISRLEILTTLQLVNFILWGLIAKTQYASIYLHFILMVWTGLMGGASYVNTNYQLLKSQRLKQKEKELGVNICCIGNDTAVLSAAIFALIVSNTIFKDQQ